MSERERKGIERVSERERKGIERVGERERERKREIVSKIKPTVPNKNIL